MKIKIKYNILRPPQIGRICTYAHIHLHRHTQGIFICWQKSPQVIFQLLTTTIPTAGYELFVVCVHWLFNKRNILIIYHRNHTIIASLWCYLDELNVTIITQWQIDVLRRKQRIHSSHTAALPDVAIVQYPDINIKYVRKMSSSTKR